MIFVLLVVNLGIFVNFGLRKSFTIRTGFLLNLSFQSIYCSSCIYVLCLALRRIRLMNEILKQPLSSSEALRKSCLTFIKFQETILLMNKCFCVSFVVRINEFILHNFTITFYVYCFYANESSRSAFAFFFALCVYTSLEAALVLPIVIVSSLIKSEVSKFGNLFNMHQKSLLRYSKATKLDDLYGEASISCGIFEIDWKLLFWIVTTIFTYTIILIQFDMTERFSKW